jgi:hypothetical protein
MRQLPNLHSPQNGIITVKIGITRPSKIRATFPIKYVDCLFWYFRFEKQINSY